MSKAPRSPARSSLNAPIGSLLDDSLPEADVQRLWRTLGDSAHAEQQAAPRTFGKRSWHAGLVGASVACLLALGAALWLTREPNSTPTAGPLALIDAQAGQHALGQAQALGGAAASQIALDDGSEIALAADTQLEVLENSSHSFATHLRKGRGEFEVKPGGPRRWSIECGVLTVEVIGTHFAIDRSERGVQVAVSRGIVLVRGERVADHVRRLTAGETLFVTDPGGAGADGADGKPAAASAQREAAAAQPVIDAVAPPPAAMPATPTPISPPPTAAATRRADAAPAALPPTTHARTSNDAAARWLQDADDARRHDQPERAKQLLERVITDAGHSPHAAVAALSLARLSMSDEPARAANALAKLNDREVPQSLREDILARLCEARARAGQRALARAAAVNYMRAFPHGRLRDEVRHWADMP